MKRKRTQPVEKIRRRSKRPEGLRPHSVRVNLPAAHADFVAVVAQIAGVSVPDVLRILLAVGIAREWLAFKRGEASDVDYPGIRGG